MFGRRYEGCGRVADQARARIIGHRIHVGNNLRLMVLSRRLLRSWRKLYYVQDDRYYEAVGLDSIFCLLTPCSDMDLSSSTGGFGLILCLIAIFNTQHLGQLSLPSLRG